MVAMFESTLPKLSRRLASTSRVPGESWEHHMSNEIWAIVLLDSLISFANTILFSYFGRGMKFNRAYYRHKFFATSSKPRNDSIMPDSSASAPQLIRMQHSISSGAKPIAVNT